MQLCIDHKTDEEVLILYEIANHIVQLTDHWDLTSQSALAQFRLKSRESGNDAPRMRQLAAIERDITSV